MKHRFLYFLLFSLLSCACPSNDHLFTQQYLTTNIPNNQALTYQPIPISADSLIHRGVFAPDFKAYYYTLSDKAYTQFNVLVIHKQGQSWSKPQSAFFNSHYNEHGMSFSPDGQTIYFSSTRPTHRDSFSDSWHIWRTDFIKGEWGAAELVDIPNMRNVLLSHPSPTASGALYFHASKLDYSQMDLYVSRWKDGQYQAAERVAIPESGPSLKCTPYIAPDESYLIYAAIEKGLNLQICYKEAVSGQWQTPQVLKATINENGQGNPQVSPDGRFLFYTSGQDGGASWAVKWIEMQAILE